MIKVGLTGGIGAGKSFVAQIFKSFGIPIFEADKEAKNLLGNSIILRDKIKQEFGESVFDSNGEIDRKYLSSIVFKNKKALEKLNDLIHPAVKNAFNSWVKNQKSPYVIEEAAILIESGSYKNMDKIIVVSAPEKVRIQRAASRDGSDEETVKQRIKNQISEEKRLKYANFIIKNEGRQDVTTQIKAIHKTLMKL